MEDYDYTPSYNKNDSHLWPSYNKNSDFWWTVTKYGGIGLISGLAIYKAIRYLKPTSTTPSTNVIYLVDQDESQSLYESVFSPSTNPYKQVYEALNKIPENEIVNIVVQTYGGMVVWCFKICEAIKNRREKGGKTNVYVRDYAFSAGSIIALCADEIYLNRNASLAPIDPQMNPMGVLSQISMKTIPELVKNTSIEGCKETVREGLENELNHYLEEISYYVNPKYKVETIMKKMFHSPVNHEQLFFKRHLIDFEIDCKEWDGNVDSIETVESVQNEKGVQNEKTLEKTNDLETLEKPNDSETLEKTNDSETLENPDDSETLENPDDSETLENPDDSETDHPLENKNGLDI